MRINHCEYFHLIVLGRPGTLYRSRLLTLRNNCWVNVARLNSEVVKGNFK